MSAKAYKRHLRASHCVCGPSRDVPQPQLQCCCQVLVLQHRSEQLSKEAVTPNSHDTVQILQLVQAQAPDILLCMPLQQP